MTRKDIESKKFFAHQIAVRKSQIRIFNGGEAFTDKELEDVESEYFKHSLKRLYKESMFVDGIAFEAKNRYMACAK